MFINLLFSEMLDIYTIDLLVNIIMTKIELQNRKV